MNGNYQPHIDLIPREPWSRTSYVYLLKHPITGVVGYVGVTCNPRERFCSHCYLPAKSLMADKSPKGKWIWQLARRGLVPEMELLAKVSYEGRQKTERRWIQKIHKTRETIKGFLHCLGTKGHPESAT